MASPAQSEIDELGLIPVKSLLPTDLKELGLVPVEAATQPEEKSLAKGNLYGPDILAPLRDTTLSKYVKSAALGTSQGWLGNFADDLLPGSKEDIAASQKENPLTYGTGQAIGFALSPISKVLRAVGVMSPLANIAAQSAISGAGANDGDPMQRLTSAGEAAVMAPFAALGFRLASKAIPSGASVLNLVEKVFGDQSKSKVAAWLGTKFAGQVTERAAEIAKLYIAGGAVNTALSAPETMDEALEAFKTGGSISAMAGVGLKGGIGLAKGTVNLLKEAVYNSRAEARQTLKEDIAFNSKYSDLKNQDAQQAQSVFMEGNASKRDLLEQQRLIDDGLNKAMLLKGNEGQISQRVANITPNAVSSIDSMVGTPQDPASLIGQKNKIIKSMAGKTVDITDDISAARKAILASATNTQNNITAKQRALKDLDMFEQGFKQDLADPILLKSARTTTNIPKLEESKQALQATLYDKDFRLNAQADAKRALMSLEKHLRDKINKADESGNVAKYNDLVHNLLETKAAYEEHGTPSFFQSIAQNPNEPKNLPKQSDLSRSLMTKTEIKQNGMKGEGGLNDQTAADPVLGQRIKALKSLLSSEKENALADWRNLKSADKAIPAMQKEKIATEAKIFKKIQELQAQKIKIEKSKLSASKARSKVDRGMQTISEMETTPLQEGLSAGTTAPFGVGRAFGLMQMVTKAANSVPETSLGRLLQKAASPTKDLLINKVAPGFIGERIANKRNENRALKDLYQP